MTEEVTQQILKVEMGFDQDSAAFIQEMKNKARTESTEKLISDALRVYDWYLDNRKHGLFTKRDEEWAKVDLQL